MGSEVVDQHLELCEDILEILKEENKVLKSGNTSTDSILNQKKTLLPKLDESLERLKVLHQDTPELLPALSEKLNTAKNKIMRILLLDKENEQLLLKSMIPSKPKSVQSKPFHTVKSIYDKHRIPGT